MSTRDRDGRKHPWTHREIATLRSAYGILGLAEIGRLVGRSARSVGVKATDLGIARKHWRWTPEAEAELARLVGLGWSERDIAAALGTNHNTVAKYRKRLGLPPQRHSERYRRKVAERTREQLEEEGVSSLVELRWLKRRIESKREGRSAGA